MTRTAKKTGTEKTEAHNKRQAEFSEAKVQVRYLKAKIQRLEKELYTARLEKDSVAASWQAKTAVLEEKLSLRTKALDECRTALEFEKLKSKQTRLEQIEQEIDTLDGECY